MGINYAGDCAWASVAVIKVIGAAAMPQIEVPRGCSDDGRRGWNEDVQASPSLSTACQTYNYLPLRRRAREPSPGSELAPWEGVLSEWVLAWVPQPDWESSPEYRWVPSRVDEHESRATSLIEQAGLPE